MIQSFSLLGESGICYREKEKIKSIFIDWRAIMHESKRLTLGGQLLLHLLLAPRSLCGQKASSSTSQKAVVNIG